MNALSMSFIACNMNLSAAMYKAQEFGAQNSWSRPRETGNNLDKEGQAGFIPQWVYRGAVYTCALWKGKTLYHT